MLLCIAPSRLGEGRHTAANRRQSSQAQLGSTRTLWLNVVYSYFLQVATQFHCSSCHNPWNPLQSMTARNHQNWSCHRVRHGWDIVHHLFLECRFHLPNNFWEWKKQKPFLHLSLSKAAPFTLESHIYIYIKVWKCKFFQIIRCLIKPFLKKQNPNNFSRGYLMSGSVTQ